MRINARAKGATGERELCDWLQNSFNLELKPKRNLEQVRNSGADIIYPPFAFEVKRVENLNVLNAWHQIKRAVSEPKSEAFGLIPVLAYRKNRQPWSFVISGEYLGLTGNYITLTELGFKNWVKNTLEMFGVEKCQKLTTEKASLL